MRFRQLLMAALFAAGVLAVSSPGWSQEAKESQDPKSTTKSKLGDAADDAKAAKAADEAKEKALGELKKTVADLKGELTAVKKDFGKLSDAVTGAAGDLTVIKTGAAASQAKVDGAAKSIEGIQKSIADAKAEFDASKKSVDESLKGVADIKTTAELAKLKAVDSEVISRGDTAWMLTASAFVMLMIPGLALFYGGMVRRKNILATMMQSMACLSIVGLFWVAFGYGLAFGKVRYKDFNGVRPNVNTGK